MITHDYNDLLKLIKLKKYKKILISGPQRSGTTFLSNILSQDLSYNLFDEVLNIQEFISIPNNYVVQGPQICHLLHTITDPDTLIVFLARNCNSVVMSGERTMMENPKKCWNKHPKCEISQKQIYRKNFPDFFREDVYSCYIKQNVWLSFQMFQMKTDFTTFSYDCLKDDRRFLPKEKRINFSSKQIMID